MRGNKAEPEAVKLGLLCSLNVMDIEKWVP